MLTRSIIMSSLFVSMTSSAWAGSPDQVPAGVDVFGGKVWTSATYDEAGILQTVTLNLPMQSILGAPMDEMRMFVISLPEEVQEQSFFRFVGLDWNPHGHPPLGIYTRPHFDIHFYGPTKEQLAAVDCQATTQISADKLPDGYVLPPADDPEACVPGMGVHALPVTDLQPDFQFEYTMIYGYYGTEFTFLEPMITHAFFMSKKELNSVEIKFPVGLASIPKMLPRSYSVQYVEEQDLYQIRLEGFAK